MNGISIIADTNVVVYLLSGSARIAELLDGKEVYLSFITELELFGKRNLTAPEKRKIQSFLDQCIIIDINASLKSTVIELREKYKLKLPDAIVAATAIEYNLPLFTADKQFANVQELKSFIIEV
ncbi:MAG: type II toxin-antitoxin system VapC family toxin [Bacteroidetes bacterium]|nr:type II toxin-antitoxin system VapC family toxin [Bacteroidota bacterium]